MKENKTPSERTATIQIPEDQGSTHLQRDRPPQEFREDKRAQFLVVIIPALNEESTVGQVIERIPRTIDGISHVEVLVVDDGSADRTAELARNAGATSPLKNGGQTNRTGRRSGAAALAACPPKTLSCHKLRQLNVFGRQNSNPRFERERRFASAHVQKLV